MQAPQRGASLQMTQKFKKWNPTVAQLPGLIGSLIPKWELKIVVLYLLNKHNTVINLYPSLLLSYTKITGVTLKLSFSAMLGFSSPW